MSGLVHGGDWEWREPRRGHPFRTCNYCGSINPDDLAKVEGWTPDWADRKYGWPHKAYIRNFANPNPDLDFCIEAGNAPVPNDTETMRFKLVADLTGEERAICKGDGMDSSGSRKDRYVGFGKRQTLFVKLYSEHLADDAISDETKESIGKKIGLRFEFAADGRIKWVQA